MHLFKNTSVAAILLGALAGTGSACAASLSFFLDESDALPDGPSYLKVTIADATGGDVDFTVETLGPLASLAGPAFGIQSFAFNVVPGGFAEGANVRNLPDGWIVRDGYVMSGFGRFDIKLYGGGSRTASTLTFSVTGVDLDDVASYASLSTGSALEGHSFFSARIAGLAGSPTGAFVGGSAPVPLPAAGGLAVACVPWLYSYGRRRKQRKDAVTAGVEHYGLTHRVADLSLFFALCAAEWLRRRFRHAAPAQRTIPGGDSGSAV